MLSGNCTEALSIQASVTLSYCSAKLINNGIAPLPFPPRAAEAILVHKARGEGQGEGTCSILCNVRVYKQSDDLAKAGRLSPLTTARRRLRHQGCSAIALVQPRQVWHFAACLEIRKNHDPNAFLNKRFGARGHPLGCIFRCDGSEAGILSTRGGTAAPARDAFQNEGAPHHYDR